MPDRSEPEADPSGPEDGDDTLDLRGLKCPLPVLHTRRALARARTGSRLDVRCTDPLASLDIPNLLRETGDILLANTRQDGEMRFRILKVRPVPAPAGPATEDPSAAADVDQPQ